MNLSVGRRTTGRYNTFAMWVLLALVVVVGIVCGARSCSRHAALEEAESERKLEEEDRLIQDLLKHQSLPALAQNPPDLPLVLKTGEQLLKIFPNISLLDHRKESISFGGRSLGISIPTGIKGVRLHPRWYSGQARYSHEVLKEIDYGDLFVTSCRIIFQGSRKNIVLPMKNIVSVETRNKVLCISDEKKEKVVILKGFSFLNYANLFIKKAVQLSTDTA